MYLLPEPFAWVDIPGGEVGLIERISPTPTYLSKTGRPKFFDTETFRIGKYPITNAQFAEFVNAGGYQESRWWTPTGWNARLKGWAQQAHLWVETNIEWIEPRFWNDPKWNKPDHPVVGVSWHEAIAFCNWLRETSGEEILLPTEDEWQRAAQGNTGRAYPWGDEWSRLKCNHNLKQEGVQSTTAVTQYEGKGDSIFGVVDMAGNVWEWCLTMFESGKNTLDSPESRVLRGGSWTDCGSTNYRADYRMRGRPYFRNYNVGFRIAWYE